MARFDVYENPQGHGYLLDVQANLLDGLNTRVVVPLMLPSEAPAPAERLNPKFNVGGINFIMVTQFLATLPRSELCDPAGSLEHHHIDITNALDMLFQGF